LLLLLLLLLLVLVLVLVLVRMLVLGGAGSRLQRVGKGLLCSIRPQVTTHLDRRQ
jgi:hypothetical protein